MQATWDKYELIFKRPGGTSRGVLHVKASYFITIEKGKTKGIGECGILKGLSCDDRPDYETQLDWTCQNIHLGLEGLYNANVEFPSIQFGLEMAFNNLKTNNKERYFDTSFLEGKQSIPINGLIWMGDIAFMEEQISQKLEEGFRCLKLKIGALDWQAEHHLLSQVRKRFGKESLEIRVDANGGFSEKQAPQVLEQLAALSVHSIEQPIKAGLWDEMHTLCANTPVPIALDEELIGLTDYVLRERMLDYIQPQFIILKPSFIGGWCGSDHWIALATKRGIGWWATSALESNIGLNAIAQWAATKALQVPQGLGTGGLFTNNFERPLKVVNGNLWYVPQ